MIPKRTFNNKSGFQAQADVHVNSPTQSNNQNVNLILSTDSSVKEIKPTSLTKDRTFKLITNSKEKPQEIVLNQNKSNLSLSSAHLVEKSDEDEQLNSLSNVKERDIKLDEGLDDGLEEHLKERSITSAQRDLEEMQAIITDKDHLIQAMSLIIDLYQNNPLIVNKLIIPEENELINLLFLLTGAEEIELMKSDEETGCTCKIGKFIRVTKIMVKKNDNTYKKYIKKKINKNY